MYMRGRTVALIVVFAVLFSSLTTAVVMGDGGLLSRATGSSFFGGVSSNSGLEDHLNKLKEAYGTIKTQYIGEVDDQKLIDGAIRGWWTPSTTLTPPIWIKKRPNSFIPLSIPPSVGSVRKSP